MIKGKLLKKRKDKGKINDMVWNLGMYSFIF